MWGVNFVVWVSEGLSSLTFFVTEWKKVLHFFVMAIY